MELSKTPVQTVSMLGQVCPKIEILEIWKRQNRDSEHIINRALVFLKDVRDHCVHNQGSKTEGKKM